MNLIRFTFANLFDYLEVLENTAMNPNYANRHGSFNLSNNIHESDLDKLQITFEYNCFTGPIIRLVNSICTPTNIKDLHE